MIETILLAFFIAKLRGYKLRPLFKSWTIYPILIFALMYVIFEFTVFMGNYSLIKYTKIFHFFYLLIFLVLIIKYQIFISAIIGSIFIFIGTICNNVVISANGGKMPVFPTLSYVTGYAKANSFNGIDNLHVLGNGATKLKFLTDIFDVGYSIMSIGDILIRLFAFIIIYNSIKHVNKTKFDLLKEK